MRGVAAAEGEFAIKIRSRFRPGYADEGGAGVGCLMYTSPSAIIALNGMPRNMELFELQKCQKGRRPQYILNWKLLFRYAWDANKFSTGHIKSN